MKLSLYITKRPLLTAALMLMCILGMEALPLEHYATNSRLAKGRWRRIEVSETGMQLITTAQLKAWGFSNPEKVNVYGYGGQKMSMLLNTNKYIDDLPMQPVIRTEKGIVFYGTSTVTWGPMTSYTSLVPFMAVQNNYSAHSYYFLSDNEADAYTMPEQVCTPDSTISERTTTFTARLLHEKDLAAPFKSGAWMLGEDFTQQRNQEFKFKLPGLASEDVKVRVGFGAASPNNSKFFISANGTKLPKSGELALISGDERFIEYRYVDNSVTTKDEDLTVGVEYSVDGVVNFARLGSIAVAYERNLKLDDGLLSFYSRSSYNMPCVYEIAGCSSTTEIWDVTDPAKPIKVIYKLEGDKALFSPPSYEYREYMAFEPGKVKLTPKMESTMVQNQDIHSVETPDMVIISPKEYLSHAKRIAQMHSDRDNMDIYIVTPEALYNEFSSGSLDPTAFRKALKMWYDRNPEKLKYVLLLGRATYDHRGITDAAKSRNYPTIPAYQVEGESLASSTSSGLHTESQSYLTDDYIVMLNDNRVTIDLAKAYNNIAVGRMPFTSQSHATQMVDKLLKYVESPEYGNWRNHVLMIADNGDAHDHLDQSIESYTRMMNNGGKPFHIERIFLGGETPVTNSTGIEYPAAKQQMMRAYDQGTGLVWYIGHANTREWTHENFFNYTDICNMSNRLWPIFMTATCQFSRWDDDAISGGEILWSHPESGSIAAITTTRSVSIANNNKITNPLAMYALSKDEKGKPRTLGDIVKRAKNTSDAGVTDRLFFQIMGDPAMRMPWATLNVEVEKLGDISLDTVSDSDVPVIKGGSRMKVSGIIKKGNNIAKDFNGTLYLTLFDAERAIETKDPLTETQEVYNNRTTRLYDGVIKVTSGRWETVVPVPTAIENNFSPALMTLYAYSEDGDEANGYTDKLIVYGQEENITDTEGPEITGIGLNSYQFKSGSQVSPNPVFFASFTDPSGINQSKAGIGNEMNICIDGKTYYNNLLDYYKPDVDDENSGSVAYPLSDLEPGRHTMTFTVSDIHGNVSTKSLDFAVTVSGKPILYDVSTNCNPATTSVTFILLHDRLSEATDCTVDVFDLSGRKIWSQRVAGKSGLSEGAQVTWDLNDGSGRRVPRGIYLYRATVKTAEGISVSKTRKLAVTAR